MYNPQRNERIYKTIAHEWFHIGQKNILGVNLNEGYAEFENWLFADIRETIRLGGDFDINTFHKFACFKNDNEDYKEGYINWLKSITNNGTTYPTLSQVRTMGFYNYGPIFAKEVRTEYSSILNFSTNNSYVPQTMITLFNNCN